MLKFGHMSLLSSDIIQRQMYDMTVFSGKKIIQEVKQNQNLTYQYQFIKSTREKNILKVVLHHQINKMPSENSIELQNR